MRQLLDLSPGPCGRASVTLSHDPPPRVRLEKKPRRIGPHVVQKAWARFLGRRCSQVGWRPSEGSTLLPTARLAQSAERKALNLVVVGLSPTVGVTLGR